MKTNRFLLVCVSLATVLALSCSDDNNPFKNFIDDLKGQIVEITASNILQNSSGMGFMPATGIPQGQTDVIEDVKISGSAISGGSTSITVTSSEKLKELYLQIEGEDGYYVRELTAEDETKEGSKYIYFIVLEFYQELEGELEGDEKLKITVSGLTANDKVVEEVEREMKTIKAGAGSMQISLSWDKYDDLDLHVYSPSGKHLYFGNRNLTATTGIGKAELDIDSNAGCNIDEINSENIFFDDPLEDGDYKVEVRLYRKCSSQQTAGARYHVTANLDGKFIKFSDKQSGQFTDTSDYDEKADIGTIKIINGAFVNN
jgi:hypothetical protein